MKNSVESINMFKRAARRVAPWALTASLTAQALFNPGVAAAQTSRPAEAPVQIPSYPDGKIDTYVQCGGRTAPQEETVGVVVSLDRTEDPNKPYAYSYEEFPLGRKPGECGNKNMAVSSIVYEHISRSNLDNPEVLSQHDLPISCPKWAVGYQIERLEVVDGIDYEPQIGPITEEEQRVRLKIHTDLLADGPYFPVANVNCISPEGAAFRTYDIKAGVLLRP